LQDLTIQEYPHGVIGRHNSSVDREDFIQIGENASTIFDQDPDLTKKTEASVFEKYYDGIDLQNRQRDGLKMRS
jgi:hypothetical protein